MKTPWCGGEVAGLLRFQNSDLVEGRNLLGRLTMAVSTAMNAQHKLGLDLDGNFGGNLFTPASEGPKHPPACAPGHTEYRHRRFDAGHQRCQQVRRTDYEVSFSSATSAPSPAAPMVWW